MLEKAEKLKSEESRRYNRLRATAKLTCSIGLLDNFVDDGEEGSDA